MKTISGARCASSFDHARPGTTPCSYSTCRSLISPTAGAARFRNMDTRGSTPNKQMPKKGTRPLAMEAAEGSIVVNAPVLDVYERWLAFEEYPKFITAIRRVRKLDTNHFYRVARFQRKATRRSLRLCCVFRSEGWPGELFPTVTRPNTSRPESFPSRRVLTERHALLSS